MTTSTYKANWKLRERKYTTKYSGQVYKVLQQQWRKAAKQYSETQTFEINESQLEVVYRRLYDQVSKAETEIVLSSMRVKKDIFSAIAQLFSRSDSQLSVSYISTLMKQYFTVYILERLRKVNGNTQKEIQDIILQGTQNGLSPKEIAKLILEKANSSSNQLRAVRIARTEVVTAANRAQLLTHEASPFEYTKAWLPVIDDVTRDSHLIMNPKNFIDLWDYFQVRNRLGGIDNMIAPGDGEASLENIVHCRCVMLFKLKLDKNGKPIRK